MPNARSLPRFQSKLPFFQTKLKITKILETGNLVMTLP